MIRDSAISMQLECVMCDSFLCHYKHYCMPNRYDTSFVKTLHDLVLMQHLSFSIYLSLSHFPVNLHWMTVGHHTIPNMCVMNWQCSMVMTTASMIP